MSKGDLNVSRALGEWPSDVPRVYTATERKGRQREAGGRGEV